MRAKLFALAAVVVAAAVAAFFLLDSGGGDEVPPTDVGRRDQGREAVTPEADELAGVSAAERAAARTVAEAPVGPKLGAGAIGEDHPWAGELAGITGRLVEEDGTPVAGLPVELMEVDITSILKTEHSPLGLDSPDVDSAVSGEDGRFVLDGARISAYHALSIGRGTGRAQLRLIDQALENGKRTDLGDIVLPAFATIVGTVIDEDGEPVEGARIRALPVPRIVMDVGTLDVREGVSVFAHEPEDPIEESFVFDVPDRVFTYLERLPIPTTYSGEDGTFRLEGVMPGSVSGGADAAGHVAAVFGQIDLEAGDEHDVGELELLFGRDVTGRVVDMAGEGVAGAEVLVGATLAMAPVAIMQPAGVADDDGYFSMEGIPETGQLVAVARRTANDAWTPAQAQGLSTNIEVKLTTAHPVTVRLSDAEGEPVEDAEIVLRSNEDEGQMMEMMFAMEMLRGEAPQPAPSREVEPGVYEVDRVTFGSWQVEATAPGFADALGNVNHTSEGTSLSMTMSRGKMLRITALDGATGEPVADAHVALVGPRGMMFDAYESAFTDETGVTELGPLSDTWYEDMTSGARGFLNGVSVVAEHPKFGKALQAVNQESIDVTVQMPVACTVQGRVHWGGEDPSAVYMLALRHQESEQPMLQMMEPPRTSVSNLTGHFRFTGVAPGTYMLTVMERYFDGDPIKLIVDQKEPTLIEDRQIVVEVGEPTYVDVELSPSGEGPRGAFVGRITSNGGPLTGLQVTVSKGGDTVEELMTDGAGEFRTEEYPVMERYRVEISGEIPQPDGSLKEQEIFSEWRRPRSGEPDRIDIDLTYSTIVVQVVDAGSGAPVANVRASLTKTGGRRWRNRSGGDIEPSGADGMLNVLLPDKDEYRLTLEGEGIAKTTVDIDASKIVGAAPHMTVRVQAAVPCSGTVVLPEGDNAWFRIVRATDEEPQGFGNQEDTIGWFGADEEDGTFTVPGMLPGEYRAQLWNGPGGFRTVEFELGPNGDTNLVLDFVNAGG